MGSHKIYLNSYKRICSITNIREATLKKQHRNNKDYVDEILQIQDWEGMAQINRSRERWYGVDHQTRGQKRSSIDQLE